MFNVYALYTDPSNDTLQLTPINLIKGEFHVMLGNVGCCLYSYTIPYHSISFVDSLFLFFFILMCTYKLGVHINFILFKVHIRNKTKTSCLFKVTLPMIWSDMKWYSYRDNILYCSALSENLRVTNWINSLTKAMWGL